jgi:putative membrane protein
MIDVKVDKLLNDDLEKELRKYIEYLPYKKAWPAALRYRGSVIKRNVFKIIVLTIWTSFWCILYEVIPLDIAITGLMIQILNIVVSLLLVFRTNTAYDRFWEGRRLWGNMISSVRNLARIIWVGFESDMIDEQVKKKVLDIIIAFTIATKYHLRARYSRDFDDLVARLEHIKEFKVALEHERARLIEEVNPRKRKHPKKKYIGPPTNIPVEISVYLTSYINEKFVKENADASRISILMNALSTTMEHFAGLERILYTPIPLAYSIHLAQCLWIYCLALPFQMVKDFGWITIPAVALVGFTMLGIQSIGEEIENPFGYDANDLPLSKFCIELQKEIDDITKMDQLNINQSQEEVPAS